MRRAPSTSSRRRRLLSLLPLIALMIAAAAFVVATRTQAITPEATPVSFQEALDSYRAHPGALRDDIGFPTLPVAADPEVKGFTVPAAGVYTYRTVGEDAIVYEGDDYRRSFPAESYATVHHGGGCVWELYFTPIQEHTDAHRQCSAPGEYLCLAHMQKVSFAGIKGEETHHCSPAMIQVGGKAVAAGGVEETICEAHGNRARIVITYVGEEVITVEGEPRPTHHVRIDSYVNGAGLDGDAVADAWFDVQDGLYLKLVREADVTVDRDGSKGTYRISATYDLVSRTPRT